MRRRQVKKKRSEQDKHQIHKSNITPTPNYTPEKRLTGRTGNKSRSRSHECVFEITPGHRRLISTLISSVKCQSCQLFAQRAAWVISNPAWPIWFTWALFTFRRRHKHREKPPLRSALRPNEDCGNVWSDLTRTSSFLLKSVGLIGSQTDTRQVSTVENKVHTGIVLFPRVQWFPMASPAHEKQQSLWMN